jgi:hypothetical protein
MISYLAGSTSPVRFELYANRSGANNFLFTFAHKDARQCAEYLCTQPQRQIFVDSGAFSVWTKGTKVKLGEYITFCKKIMELRKCPVVFAALDVIAGNRDSGFPTVAERARACEEGWDNYQTMKQEGIPCIMTHHQFENPRWLARMMDESDYIALSPRKVGVSTEEKAHWLRERFRYIGFKAGTKMPRVKVHGLGVSSPVFIEAFPFYSVDSTAWLQGAKTGAYRTFDGFRMSYIPQGQWAANLPVCASAIHRHRPPGEQQDQSGDTGIYFFAIRAMAMEVHFETYISSVWREQGVVWSQNNFS